MGNAAVPGGAPPGMSAGRGALWQQSRTGGDRGGAAANVGPDSRQALDQAYQAHYPSLVRLAALLTGDARLGEQVAEDAFVALFRTVLRIRRPEAELSRLLRLVVLRSRQAGRLTDNAVNPGSDFAATPVVQALSALPRAQREAVVMMLYVDLTEDQAAAAVGVSRGVLRRNVAQAKLALSGLAAQR
jgi:DNA-directed RNA polymerase specialized sigma24 family protein